MTEKTANFYGIPITKESVEERVIPQLDIVATIPTVDGNTITVNTTTNLTVGTNESLKVEVFINNEYIGEEYLIEGSITVVLEAGDLLTYRAVEVV